MSPRAKTQAGGIIRKSADTTWKTPEYVLERVRSYFCGPIPFDPATAPDNPTQAIRFCAGPAGTLFAKDTLESKNGLEVSWDWPWWVNPPFNREWIEKIGLEGARRNELGLALLPCNRFEEAYHQRMMERAKAVCFVNARPWGKNGRIAFISSIDGEACSANPFGSMILGFGVNLDDFVEAFQMLGNVLLLRKLGGPA